MSMFAKHIASLLSWKIALLLIQIGLD